jgi:hypothetical protein
MTGNMVLSMALIDVLRIYVMQLVGRFVLQVYTKLLVYEALSY